jgi:hypothetical protein
MKEIATEIFCDKRDFLINSYIDALETFFNMNLEEHERDRIYIDFLDLYKTGFYDAKKEEQRKFNKLEEHYENKIQEIMKYVKI